MAIGTRAKATARKLWASLPGVYRQCAITYTDFWEAYAAVLPSKRHRAVGKESGQTNHIERFNNTLRQRCSRLVRKTLSSRKSWPIISVRCGILFMTITLANAPNVLSLLLHDYHNLRHMHQNKTQSKTYGCKRKTTFGSDGIAVRSTFKALLICSKKRSIRLSLTLKNSVCICQV